MTNYLSQASTSIQLGQSQPTGIVVGTNPGTIITNAVTIIFTVGAVALLFMLIWAAFERITSGGDKEKIAASSKRITNAIIGLVLLALAFLIARVIGLILNFDLLGPLPLPSLGQPVAPTTAIPR